MTQIRFAIVEDLPAIVELAPRAHQESRFASIPFKARRLWSALETHIQRGNSCVLVAYDAHNDLIGFLLGHLQRYDFASSSMACLQHWYVTPENRGSFVAMKLFAGFKQWARQREAVEILIKVQFDTQRIDKATLRILQKSGVKPVGTVMSRWVD